MNDFNIDLERRGDANRSSSDDPRSAAHLLLPRRSEDTALATGKALKAMQRWCFWSQPPSTARWRAWREATLQTLVHCTDISTGSLALGEAERYAHVGMRTEIHRSKMGNELSALLANDHRPALHDRAYAYFFDWSAALAHQQEVFQFDGVEKIAQIQAHARVLLTRHWLQVEAALARPEPQCAGGGG